MTQATERNGTAASRREERLAQALRDNLKRRKEQLRGRVMEERAAADQGDAAAPAAPPRD